MIIHSHDSTTLSHMDIIPPRLLHTHFTIDSYTKLKISDEINILIRSIK